MSDLIRRQDAIDACISVANNINSPTDQQIGAEYCLDLINEIPSADPERTAKVDNVKAGGLYGVLNGNCGWCKSYVEDNCTFCPYCGVKLDWSE